MNLSELHSISEFAALFSDRRFKAVLVYVRENFPRASLASGDEWRGRYDVLKEIEYLQEPPKGSVQRTEPVAPYTKKP